MTTSHTLDGPRVAPASGGAPRSLVILLHGYGSNGDDLISLAPYWRDALPHTAFVSPNAPERCPGAPGGYQWWGITSLDPDARKAGAVRAAPALNAFIDAELAGTGLTAANLALVGFQLEIAIRQKENAYMFDFESSTQFLSACGQTSAAAFLIQGVLLICLGFFLSLLSLLPISSSDIIFGSALAYNLG